MVLNGSLWHYYIYFFWGGGGGGVEQEPVLPFLVNVNPFTLRVHQESIVCYFHTFENNLEIKQIITKYLKESCW